MKTTRKGRNGSPVTGHWSLALALAAGAVAGCGVDTATTAATSAAIKQQELDAGKRAKAMADHAKKEVEQAVQQRTEQIDAGSR